MRTFKIWDVVKKCYKTRYAPGSAAQSTWDTLSTAKQIAGRLLGKGMYEIHTFKLERSYVEGEAE